MSLFRKKTAPAVPAAPACAAVIVAAGHSTRMGGTDKTMAPLCGKPVIWYTIRAFDLNPLISEIVVVTREELMAPIARLCKESDFAKVRLILVGGATRPESVLIGAENVSKNMKLIAIHDGARPFVSQRIITDTVLKAADFGAAAPAVAVKDTVKAVRGDTVEKTPPRASLRAVQTPQIFDADLIRGALTAATESDAAVTDDCACVERIGMRVFLTEGAEENFKITTPLDLRLAEYLAEEGNV